MNRFSAALLSFIELLEAEGRELRFQAESFVRRSLFLFFGGLSLFVAALAVMFAFFVFAAPIVGRAAAALFVAAAFAALGYRLMRKAKTEIIEQGEPTKESDENVR